MAVAPQTICPFNKYAGTATFLLYEVDTVLVTDKTSVVPILED